MYSFFREIIQSYKTIQIKIRIFCEIDILFKSQCIFHSIFLRETKFSRYKLKNNFPRNSTVWKNEKFTWHAKYFSSNQFRVKFLKVRKLLWRNFCDKMVAVKFHNFHTVHVTQRGITCIHLFFSLQKLREINVFVTKILNKVFSRNFFLVSVSCFLLYIITLWHSVEKTRNSLTPKKNSSNQLYSNFFSKTITFTKILQKSESVCVY